MDRAFGAAEGAWHEGGFDATLPGVYCPACVNLTVTPATRIVPLRDRPVVFAATA